MKIKCCTLFILLCLTITFFGNIAVAAVGYIDERGGMVCRKLWDFDTDGDTGGFRALRANDTITGVSGGFLRYDIGSSMAGIIYDDQAFGVKGFSNIAVRLKNVGLTNSWSIRITFTTKNEPSASADKEVIQAVTLPSGGEYVTAYIYMDANEKWKGQEITSLTVYPCTAASNTSLMIDYIAVIDRNPPMRWEFDTSNDSEGIRDMLGNGVISGVENGLLNYTINTAMAGLVYDDTSFSGYPYLTMRIRNEGLPATWTFRLLFKTVDEPSYSGGDKEIIYLVPQRDAGEFTTIYVNMGSNSKWRDKTITGVRIYPATSAVNTTLSIDYIRLCETDGNPSVSMMESRGIDSFAPGQPIQLCANATVPDGRIEKVEYYANQVLIGESTQPPYLCEWLPPLGEHQIKAKAYASNGRTAESGVFDVRVIQDYTLRDVHVAYENEYFTAQANVTKNIASAEGCMLILAVYKGKLLTGISFAEKVMERDELWQPQVRVPAPGKEDEYSAEVVLWENFVSMKRLRIPEK